MTKLQGIVLGKGAPNICKDGKKTMCAIVLTESLGFIRVYPLNVCDEFCLWAIVDMNIEKSTGDSRKESWKILESEYVKKIEDSFEKRRILDRCVLNSGSDDPIDYQNKKRSSIALVKPIKLGSTLMQREEDLGYPAIDDNEIQPWVTAQSQMPVKPYLNWTSIQGKDHCSHIVSQEVYMGLFNNPCTPHDVFSNMRIMDRDYDKWLLIGNMRNRRSVWVAVHVHRLKKTTQKDILSNCETADGRPKGWPYCEQETTSVRSVPKQKQFQFTT